MTKEEIIAQHVVSERKIPDFNQAAAYDFKYITVPNARIAMDEYAKQQAIAFDVWKRENCITYDYDNRAYSKLIFLDVDHTKVRTEQLSIDDTYNQFIEQQNKP